jgi:hypothetical protein
MRLAYKAGALAMWLSVTVVYASMGKTAIAVVWAVGAGIWMSMVVDHILVWWEDR